MAHLLDSVGMVLVTTADIDMDMIRLHVHQHDDLLIFHQVANMYLSLSILPLRALLRPLLRVLLHQAQPLLPCLQDLQTILLSLLLLQPNPQIRMVQITSTGMII